MRLPRLRFSLRSSMIAVAVSAVVLLLFKPPESHFRYVEVFYRNANNSIKAIEHMIFDLDAPDDWSHGFPDGKTKYSQEVARLKASKAEYRITSPRGFKLNGTPIP
jgi:hypothetical protein